MDNSEIINKYYKKSVEGITEVMLEDKDLWYSYVIHLPIHLQVVYTTVIFHRQVFNGGIHQYFFNGYGQFAYLTLDHFRLIKASNTLNILEKALKEVNIENYREIDFRDLVFNRKLSRIVDFDDDLFEYLNQLDHEYYSQNEDLIQLLADYLRNLQ